MEVHSILSHRKTIDVKQRLIFQLLVLASGLMGCNSDNNNTEEQYESSKCKICWNIIAEDIVNTRALIQDQASLQSSCTPTTSGGGGKAIGIYGTFTLQGNTYPIFDNEKLTYATKGTTPHMWNYHTGDRYWVTGGEYKFIAYYPQNNNATNVSTTINYGEYDTQTTQDDLMTAFAEVNTNLGTFNPNSPVNLDMKHALAAMKFVFTTSDENDTLQLKSIYLYNPADGLGLSTTGKFSADATAYKSTDWTNDTPVMGKYYEWEHSKGLVFGHTDAEAKMAYTDAVNTKKGILFAENGNILILPQTCATKPQLYFSTTYNDYGPIELPGTNIFNPGYRYIYNITITKYTGVNITLKIKKWNELDSSYNITF